MPAEITLTNEQQVKATVKPVTATGKPAPVEKIAWSVISGNGTVGRVTDDGTIADLLSSDDPGDTQFLVKADADMGEGVTEISDVVLMHVSGAQAENMGLTLGDPTPKG